MPESPSAQSDSVSMLDMLPRNAEPPATVCAGLEPPAPTRPRGEVLYCLFTAASPQAIVDACARTGLPPPQRVAADVGALMSRGRSAVAVFRCPRPQIFTRPRQPPLVGQPAPLPDNLTSAVSNREDALIDGKINLTPPTPIIRTSAEPRTGRQSSALSLRFTPAHDPVLPCHQWNVTMAVPVSTDLYEDATLPGPHQAQ